ncbi:O-antigen ligase family protein [Sporosarcina limicola]|uniref:O-antigen ligase n=1 Tax=Sporosarcina limicola TaxID=34101 RepID=A0A927MTI4_9BACL|nr:O-antigen ligase family protein [Sporosarcina limicola]MBE1557081.1 O-antigen ligase [Sporosarcina limicola]
MTESKHRWLTYYLFVTLAISSIVSFEPSPYDLFMIVVVLLGFLFSLYIFTRETVFPLLVVCIFLLTNLLSLFFVKELGVSLKFTGITFYLAITWIGLMGLGHHLKQTDLQFIMKGYLFSALFAASIGILSYLHLLPGSEKYLMFGRAKAFFKDPNVFGPFLVMPALFALSMIEIRKNTAVVKSFYFIVFLILTVGVVLSFSRAAWGNFIISLIIYLFIYKKEVIRKRFKTVLLLLLIGVPSILYFIQTPAVEDLLISRLSYQNYDNDRFDTQKAALLNGLKNPFGIGGGQSEIAFQYSPHSLYARVFTENGIVGLLSLFVLFSCSLHKSHQHFWRIKDQSSALYLVIFASLVGLAFNSFFIDTLHWRYLWLVLALAWIPSSNKKQGEKRGLKT